MKIIIDDFIVKLRSVFSEYEFLLEKQGEGWCRIFVSIEGLSIGRINFSPDTNNTYKLFGFKNYIPLVATEDFFIRFDRWYETLNSESIKIGDWVQNTSYVRTIIKSHAIVTPKGTEGKVVDIVNNRVYVRGKENPYFTLMENLTKVENINDWIEDFNIEALVKVGYRRVSNKHKMISRIDNSNWLDIVYDNGIMRNSIMLDQLKDYYKGVDFSGTFSEKSIISEATICADYYRRCISKDKIGILEWSHGEFSKIPLSNHDAVGYVGYKK